MQRKWGFLHCKQCPRSAIAEQFSYLLVSAIFICFCCNCEGLNLELSYGQIDDNEPPKVVKKGKSGLESLPYSLESVIQ
jgi:hypothetical protein